MLKSDNVKTVLCATSTELDDVTLITSTPFTVKTRVYLPFGVLYSSGKIIFLLMSVDDIMIVFVVVDPPGASTTNKLGSKLARINA